MSDVSANLSLPYIQPSQAQKHVTHNEAIRRLDAVVQIGVLDVQQSPPTDPNEGERWIVDVGATGTWAGQDHAVALWDGTAWMYFIPDEGWIAFNRETDGLLIFNGAQWVGAFASDTSLSDGSLKKVGVNTAPDTINRLSVKTDRALFSHDDITPGNGDMVIVTNKDTSGNDTGVTFQTGYSTRTLFGLYGNDDTSLKVSPDGATFHNALSVSQSTGNIAFGASTAASTPGAVNAGGALMVQREANAHGTNSAHTALVVGAPGDQGGACSVARQDLAHAPFTGLGGWDDGNARTLSFGGGGWASPDATEHRFYCAPSYSETTDTGLESLCVSSGSVRNGTSVLHAASTANGAQMQFKIIEEIIATPTGTTVDSTVQIPNGAIVFNVSMRVTTAVTGASSFDVGTSSNSGQFGSSLGTAQGSTNPGTIGPTGFYANTNIRLTANGAQFSGGAIRVAICCYLPVPPSA